MVETHQFPCPVIGLVVQLCDAAIVHVEIPTVVEGPVRDMTHHDADQAFVTDDQRILIPVGCLFFVQKRGDAAARFFPGFALGEAEVGPRLTHGPPLGREFFPYLFFGGAVEQAVVDLVQAFVDNREQFQGVRPAERRSVLSAGKR